MKASKPSILIIDDLPFNVRLLSESLKSDYNISVATDGHDAISLASKYIPDLILLDIMMPEIDGFTLCSMLKNIKGLEEVPIIFLTAKHNTESIIKGFELGASDYITKPFNTHELVVRIRNYIKIKTYKDQQQQLIIQLKEQQSALESELLQKQKVQKALSLKTQELSKRIKELSCLYNISNLTAKPDIYIDEILSYTVKFICDSWEPANAVCCHIILEGKEYKTDNFLPTKWSIKYNINYHGDKIGYLELYYITPSKSYPFLKEEADLLKAVTLRIENIIGNQYLEQEILKSKKLKAASVLAGGIAHDFNNLLHIILGNISMAKEQVLPESSIEKYLKQAKKAVLQASRLTQKFLIFATGGTVDKEQTIITSLIEEVIQETLNDSGIQCNCFFDDHIFPVELDKKQITQVFYNVIENAKHAMPGGGVLDIYVKNMFDDMLCQKFNLDPEYKPFVKVSVHDNGVGIRPEELSNIFDPYFSTKENFSQKGMGLGLAMSLSIIKKHNGAIVVDSEYEKGTQVHICLPAVKI